MKYLLVGVTEQKAWGQEWYLKATTEQEAIEEATGNHALNHYRETKLYSEQTVGNLDWVASYLNGTLVKTKE